MREQLQAFLAYLGSAYRLGFYTTMHVFVAAVRGVHAIYAYAKLHAISIRAVIEWHLESWEGLLSRRRASKRNYGVDVLLSALTLMTWPVFGPLWVYYALRKLTSDAPVPQDTTQPAGLD